MLSRLVMVFVSRAGAEACRPARSSTPVRRHRAGPPAQTAQTALAEGTPHRLTVQPGTPVTFRLEPAAPFVDATVTFDGVEVMATLRHGAPRR